ncbi:Unknown protein, partial [Striga hermonthica]
LSLIGQSFGEKKINFFGMKHTLSGIWATKQPFSVRNLGDNKFQFVFQSEEDKNRVMEGKTWSFDGKYLLLKQWDPEDLEFHEEEKVIKIWVQVWNLPLHWVSEDAGAKIGKKIGRVHNVVITGEGSVKGHLIKILVEMKLKDPIMRGTNIKVGDTNRWVDFRYEGIQSFCFYCGLIGHSDKSCQSKKDDLLRNKFNGGQFGDWLRTTSIFISEGRSFQSKFSDNQSSEPNSEGIQKFVSSPSSRVRENAIVEKSRENSSVELKKHGEGISEMVEGKGKEIVMEGVELLSIEEGGTMGILEIPPGDDQLIEVNIQASAIGKNVLNRKKKTFVRKSRIASSDNQDKMLIENP